MIDIVNKRCGHPDCNTVALFGVDGTTKPELCAEHAHDGMVSVIRKCCKHQGCRKCASFGLEESRVKEFCGTHAKKGMSGYWMWFRPGDTSALAADGSARGGGRRRRRESHEAHDTTRRGGDLGRRLRSRATAFCETETVPSAAGGSTREGDSKRARLSANDKDTHVASLDLAKEAAVEGMAVDDDQGPSSEPEGRGVGQQALQDEGAPGAVLEEEGFS